MLLPLTMVYGLTFALSVGDPTDDCCAGNAAESTDARAAAKIRAFSGRKVAG